MTTFGKFPRSPLQEAVDELNDDMRPYQFDTRINQYGYIILERVDTSHPIKGINLGKDIDRAAEYVEIITEWQREMGGQIK